MPVYQTDTSKPWVSVRFAVPRSSCVCSGPYTHTESSWLSPEHSYCYCTHGISHHASHDCDSQGSLLGEMTDGFSPSTAGSAPSDTELGSREAHPFFFLSYHLSQAVFELAILVCHPRTCLNYRQTS